MASLITLLITFFLIPLVNRFMTQVVFKSKRRTRKMLRKAYNFCKKECPNASEKELFSYTLQTAFCVLNRQDYPQEPYSRKPKSILTIDDVDEIIKKATNIENFGNQHVK